MSENIGLLCGCLIFSLSFQSGSPGFLGLTQKLAKCYRMPEYFCPPDAVSFWYFSNHIASSPGIPITPLTMARLPIIRGAPWKVIFHGFRNNKATTPNLELRRAYFQHGLYNILSADASRPIDDGPLPNVCYPTAAKNVYFIGRCFAQILAQLIRAGVLPPAHQLHLVGHSLGAHIAGNTASELRNLGMGTVLRVTGLDPAGPLLWKPSTPSFKILDSTDAQTVDVHHTSGGEWYSSGQMNQLGTADVYYNGGKKQPLCKKEMGCSHHKAVEYFAESIYPLPPEYRRFYGFSSMSSYPILVGENMQPTVRGIITVFTSENPPYALGRSTFGPTMRRGLPNLVEGSRKNTSEHSD